MFYITDMLLLLIRGLKCNFSRKTSNFAHFYSLQEVDASTHADSYISPVSHEVQVKCLNQA